MFVSLKGIQAHVGQAHRNHWFESNLVHQPVLACPSVPLALEKPVTLLANCRDLAAPTGFYWAAILESRERPQYFC
jgi:hypothetical protein